LPDPAAQKPTARREIMAKTYYLFISHSWAYGDAYERFCELLNNADYFSYKNYSVPKDDPIHNPENAKKLYEAIKTQISPCHIVIVMAGVYATYSRWIQQEIKIAKDEFDDPKPILAIKPWANTNVSSVVSDNADMIVAWNTASIVAAIRELAL
jgi:hypothetical protein